MENSEEMSMNEIMEEFKKPIPKIQAGDILKGTVISVTNEEVFVNIGYMSDGIITKDEVTSDEALNLKDAFKSGDEIYVYVMEVNDGEGNVALSKRKAEQLKIWDDLEDALNRDKTFNVKVSEVVKGGLVAELQGERAFIPASLASASYVEDLNKFLGKQLLVKVAEVDKEKRKIILSRKDVEIKELEAKRKVIWSSLKKGDKIKGKVSRLAKFGAFVDIGGMDGLIHLSDLSWKRIMNPAEVVSVGDEVEVYIVDFDEAKGRISLALKEVKMNPWKELKYKVGQIVEGNVVKILDFGAFVELEPGIEGLVHITEISENRIARVSDVIKLEDKVKVKILEINENEEKMSLSIKEALTNTEEDFSAYGGDSKEQNLTLGDLLKEKLKGIKFE